jgi:hypothetical protein
LELKTSSFVLDFKKNINAIRVYSLTINMK